MRTWVRSLASLSGLRIRSCRELWYRSQTWLGCHVAVALVSASSDSSDLTPSLETSICRRHGPKHTHTHTHTHTMQNIHEKESKDTQKVPQKVNTNGPGPQRMFAWIKHNGQFTRGHFRASTRPSRLRGQGWRLWRWGTECCLLNCAELRTPTPPARRKETSRPVRKATGKRLISQRKLQHTLNVPQQIHDQHGCWLPGLRSPKGPIPTCPPSPPNIPSEGPRLW